MPVYEIKCVPPNERVRIVRLEAGTLDEAMQRANALWMHQQRPPQLLATIDTEPQKAMTGLYAALILAGNLPAEEARKNTACRDRLAGVFHALDLALIEWKEPQE